MVDAKYNRMPPPAPTAEYPERRPGIAIDAGGGPVIDPTQNVLDLVDAAVTRLDDLRVAENRRIDEVLAAGMRRTDDMAELRAHYEGLLSAAEAKRIDAIRAVDVNAVAVASERASAAASVLASQVVASADALRALVASTAATMAQQQAQLTTQFNERIAQLEKASYEGKGRSAYADPMFSELITEVKKLGATQSQTTGKSEGVSVAWVALLGGVSLISTLVALFSILAK